MRQFTALTYSILSAAGILLLLTAQKTSSQSVSQFHNAPPPPLCLHAFKKSNNLPFFAHPHVILRALGRRVGLEPRYGGVVRRPADLLQRLARVDVLLGEVERGEGGRQRAQESQREEVLDETHCDKKFARSGSYCLILERLALGGEG